MEGYGLGEIWEKVSAKRKFRNEALTLRCLVAARSKRSALPVYVDNCVDESRHANLLGRCGFGWRLHQHFRAVQSGYSVPLGLHPNM